MKTPLIDIDHLSIYKSHGERVPLPTRMAKCTPDTHDAIKRIDREVRHAGGRLVLSDLFRSYDMQLQAHLDWKTGKKRAYSPPPGGSMHEAGRALDLSLRDLRMSLADFWVIAGANGVVPIIAEPNARKSEAWHFECRGSHRLVYDYYRVGKGTNMPPAKAMAISSILSIGVSVDSFEGRQEAALLQSMLVRLGCDLGNIDGYIGRKTRKGLSHAGITATDPTEIMGQAEDMMQRAFPEEYRTEVLDIASEFDAESPAHLNLATRDSAEAIEGVHILAVRPDHETEDVDLGRAILAEEIGHPAKVVMIVRGMELPVAQFCRLAGARAKPFPFREAIWVKDSRIFEPGFEERIFDGHEEACAVVLNFADQPVVCLNSDASLFDIENALLEGQRQ